MALKEEGLLFVKQIIAKMSGDNATDVAIYNYRMAKKAFEQGILTKQVEELKAQGDVDAAASALDDAMKPTVKIADTEAYLKNVVFCQNALTKAEEALEAIQNTIADFKSKLENLDAK
jgi:molecular chaperone DnaK (HSP70)